MLEYITKIGHFCATHPNFEELLVAEPYCLKIKEDGPYIMFSYDQIHSDFNNQIVREARGIIFKKGEWLSPVCWAFDKFGNYSENYVPELDWSSAFVTEKIDGSLIKIWFDEEWRVSTNGTIDAFKANLGDIKVETFGDLFKIAVAKYFDHYEDFFAKLDKDFTYMLELVSPYNRVVIPYKEVDIYFLGARDNCLGHEISCNPINLHQLGWDKIKTPRIFELSSLDACIKVAEEYSWDNEGFVVADKNFNRCKIKSPAYVLAHFMRNNNTVNKKHLIKIILLNEVEEFLCYADDYREELFKCKKLMNAYHNLGNAYVKICREITFVHKPDYAKVVKTFPLIFQALLFCNYERDVSAEEFTSSWNENKWENYLEETEKLINAYYD